MLGIGWSELLLIVLIALLFIKQDQLPQTAKNLGRAYRQCREVISESSQILEKEVSDIKKMNPMGDCENEAIKPPKTG